MNAQQLLDRIFPLLHYTLKDMTKGLLDEMIFERRNRRR
jgi:hypothetical protein